MNYIDYFRNFTSIGICFAVLEPYKYAGYPMLIKTIKMETNDDALFSKSGPLLSAASELAYHTVNCSALNAEELRRENGIEVPVHDIIGNAFYGYEIFSSEDHTNSITSLAG